MLDNQLKTVCKAGKDLSRDELQAIYAIRAEYMRPKNSPEQDWGYFSHHIEQAQFLYIFVDTKGQIQGSSLVFYELHDENYLTIELGLGYLRPQFRQQGYPLQAILQALGQIYEAYPRTPKYFLGVAFPAGYLTFRPLNVRLQHLASADISALEKQILSRYSLAQFGDGSAPVCNSILVPIASEAEIERYAAQPYLAEFMKYVPNWYEGFALYVIALLPDTLDKLKA